MALPRRYRPLVFAVAMSLYMACLMTLVITAVNTGLDDGLPGRWGRAFVVAWPIALALTLLGASPLQRLAAWLTGAADDPPDRGGMNE